MLENNLTSLTIDPGEETKMRNKKVETQHNVDEEQISNINTDDEDAHNQL